MRLFALLLSAILSSCLAAPAFAEPIGIKVQGSCFKDREEFLAAMVKTERLQGLVRLTQMGIDRGGKAAGELIVDHDGRWVFNVVIPGLGTCTMAAGYDWQTVPIAVLGKTS